MEQNGEANPKSPVGVWQTEFTKLRVPNLYDLLADPFERATESIYYADWQVHRVFYSNTDTGPCRQGAGEL